MTKHNLLNIKKVQKLSQKYKKCKNVNIKINQNPQSSKVMIIQYNTKIIKSNLY